MRTEKLFIGIFFTILYSFMGYSVYRDVQAATAPRVIDCNKFQPKIATKSSVDSKTYLVDICSVVDSASGEDFRTEMK